MSMSISAQIEKNKEQQKKLAERKKQLQAEANALEKKQKEAERRSRNHRLIQIGAVVESVLGRSIEEEDPEKLRAFLIRQETNGRFFSRAMNIETEKAGDESGCE